MTQSKLSRSPSTAPNEFHKWQPVFDELADLVGLSLVLYDKKEHLLGTSRPNRLCQRVQMSEQGLRLCEQDCGGMLSQATQGGDLVSFKCHTGLYNFATPIYYEGKVQFVLLGGRVFRHYQDFARFTQMAANYAIEDYLFFDWENAVKFENTLYFNRAAQFVQAMMDTLCRGRAAVGGADLKSRRLTALYELSSVLSSEFSRGKVYQLILQSLSVLFDTQEMAVVESQNQGKRWRLTHQIGSAVPSGFQLDVGDHPLFDSFSLARHFCVNETYRILRMGFPQTVHELNNFPVTCRGQLVAVIQVYNRPLGRESVQMLQAFCRHLSTVLENLWLKEELSDHSNILSVVTDFSAALGSEVSSPDLYRNILRKTADLVKVEQASLMIYDESSNEVSVKSVLGMSEKVVEGLRVKPGQGIAGFVFETGEPLLISNIDEDPRFEAQRTRYRTKSLLSVPLQAQGHRIGVLNVTDKLSGERFDAKDLKLLESIASHAAVALDRTDFYKKTEDLRKLSITDSLTELFNRRFFEERLAEEIERANRHSQPLSLIMLDVDDFKDYNDTHGHLAGDEALRMTAASLKNSVRSIDRVARYGGEEFAVILPMTELRAARDIAERIRSGVAGSYYPDESLGLGAKLTVSIGIANFPNDAENSYELVGNADKALYLAKLGGKNRVVVYDKDQGVRNAVAL